MSAYAGPNSSLRSLLDLRNIYLGRAGLHRALCAAQPHEHVWQPHSLTIRGQRDAEYLAKPRKVGSRNAMVLLASDFSRAGHFPRHQRFDEEGAPRQP